ncbi:DUF1592 domain-containing protein [Roseiconus nitratireducens]|nr:DUF1592 domain-containing protein [Roseiconus nitratireducens]
MLIATPGSADDSAHATAVQFIQNHCLDCHTGPDSERGFDLSGFAEVVPANPQHRADTAIWEKAYRRIQTRQMPPPDYEVPEQTEWRQAVRAIDRHLADHATEYPFAGHTDSLRRMTRAEYGNAIEDLLAVQVDVQSLLPPDSSSDGFDNITVGDLSPLLLDRYLTAAREISRAAIGRSIDQPNGITIRVPADQTQENHVDGLPLGTRGGTLIRHFFPRGGLYEIQVRLTRDRDEKIEGLTEPHELDVLLDRSRKHRFQVKPPRGAQGHATLDANLNTRIELPAGTHAIGVTFVQKSNSLLEIKRAPFEASYNQHRHPRQTPAIHEVSIVGPFDPMQHGDGFDASPSRRKVLIARPSASLSPQHAAKQIFRPLLRQAYRRPIERDDLNVPMEFFDQSFSESATAATDPQSLQSRFEIAIESGLTAILVNPNFLFRSFRQPPGIAPGTVYSLQPTELASRLSSFLWSSLPDEELLALAESGALVKPDVLEAQTKRMLEDPRSNALVDNFADQWLYLRNLATVTPDLRQFPSFDNNLREAFAEETRRLFGDLIRRDASVLELIESDHTFLNERLAIHYGVPKIIGSHFRKVALDAESHRGGLLRQGSLLTTTSYATRTSPTIRGAWVLDHIIGTPPPPPPPNVPTLKEKSDGQATTFRQALALHRADAACASCHDLIDPVGFALDRYDAVGRWRSHLEGDPVDASGRLPDGQEVIGVEQLERGILERPEVFVTAMVEKLMTYALGRTLEPADGPEVRKVVQRAAHRDYRFSELMTGITLSTPFRMRTSQ